MSQQFVVDRIEDQILVLISQTDDSIHFELPTIFFPEVKEGDVLILQPDDSSTQHNLDEAQARLERLKTTSPQPSKGDVIDL